MTFQGFWKIAFLLSQLDLLQQNLIFGCQPRQMSLEISAQRRPISRWNVIECCPVGKSWSPFVIRGKTNWRLITRICVEQSDDEFTAIIFRRSCGPTALRIPNFIEGSPFFRKQSDRQMVKYSTTVLTQQSKQKGAKGRNIRVRISNPIGDIRGNISFCDRVTRIEVGTLPTTCYRSD